MYCDYLNLDKLWLANFNCEQDKCLLILSQYLKRFEKQLKNTYSQNLHDF